MWTIKEPFDIIPFESKFLNKEGVEIPNFRASRLVSCYWDFYREYITNSEAIPISDSLNDIFDQGNVVHFTDECLTSGAKEVIEVEKEMKILHHSERFSLSGHIDYLKMDTMGFYIEDLKSCKLPSFYYFIKCIDEGLSEDYLYQMGVYAYELYVYIGVYIKRGVITRIYKGDDNDYRRIRMSIEDRLPSLEEMRSFILQHPVILCVLGYITEERLIELCIIQMRGQEWKCGNCQYKSTKECPVFTAIGG